MCEQMAIAEKRKRSMEQRKLKKLNGVLQRRRVRKGANAASAGDNVAASRFSVCH